MSLFKGTALYFACLVTGVAILGYLIVNGPRIPILLGLVAIIQIVPISFLTRQIRRNRTPKAFRDFRQNFSTLPRSTRREVQRKLRKADRLMQQHPCGLNRDTVRGLLDEVEEQSGVEIDEGQVPKLLIAISTGRNGRPEPSAHQVA